MHNSIFCITFASSKENKLITIKTFEIMSKKKEIEICVNSQDCKKLLIIKDPFGYIRFSGFDIDFGIDTYHEENGKDKFMIGLIEWVMLTHNFTIMDIITVLSRLKYNFNADEEVQKMEGLIKVLNKDLTKINRKYLQE